jgi:hydrogenase 3 maturation protease
MTLQKSWQESLKADLKRLQKPDCAPRLAVLGIGHELYGDDAVGVWLAGRLGELIPTNESFLAVQGGPAPENFTGTLRRYRPDLVLMVDAALMNLRPGETGWLSWQDTTGFSASTHILPLHLLASYLTAELKCEVALLGIQPAQTQVGAPLSPEVQAAAESIAKGIGEIIHTCEGSKQNKFIKPNFWKGYENG